MGIKDHVKLNFVVTPFIVCQMTQCIVIIVLCFDLHESDRPQALLSARDTRVNNNINKKQGLHLRKKNHQDAIKAISEVIEKFKEPRITISLRTNETLKEREMNCSKASKA